MVNAPTDHLHDAAHQRLLAGDLPGAVQTHLAALRVSPSHREPAKRLAVALAELGHDVFAERLEQGLREARLQAYQADVGRLRRTVYLDVPRHVHLETLARCNARCTFCPSPSLARTGARLDDALLDKVIGELADVAHVPMQISPFKVNEPLLDVRLFDLLDSIQERLPKARIALTTNGTPLTRKKLARLAAYSALNTLYVSFNDHRPDAYEQVMGLPYQRTLERLDTLHNAVASGLFSARVCVSRVGDGTPDDDAFKLWCAARWPHFGIMVSARGDWLGQVDTPVVDVPAVGCVRWFELSVTATGTVAHCCMDGQARFPIGDVREQHVLDIYNSPDFRRLRTEAVTRLEASPCSGCTYL